MEKHTKPAYLRGTAIAEYWSYEVTVIHSYMCTRRATHNLHLQFYFLVMTVFYTANIKLKIALMLSFIN